MEQILISREDFHNGLRTLKIALSGKHPPEVIMQYKDGFLFIRAGGSSFHIPAEGKWNRQARLNAKAITLLTNNLPEINPLPLTEMEDLLGIGNFRLKCHWEKPAAKLISIPINASLVHVLGLWQRYDQEEIERSGLEPTFWAADKERVRRIAAALEHLAPLGVTDEDLKTLVDEAIKRTNLENYEN